MIQDLHSHTGYSNCGRDDPDFVIRTALEGGIELLGISDHNYGIGDRKRAYVEDITALKRRYEGRIQLLCGIEIATINDLCLRPEEDITGFDYCLVEHIINEKSCVGRDIAAFAKRCGIRTGIAHTDLFEMCKKLGERPESFFASLADNGIFWEMNVNFDSIHGYHEHEYVKAFMESAEQQQIIRNSGISVSVGFDGHRVEDYLPERVKAMNAFLDAQGIPKPFD